MFNCTCIRSCIWFPSRRAATVDISLAIVKGSRQVANSECSRAKRGYFSIPSLTPVWTRAGMLLRHARLRYEFLMECAPGERGSEWEEEKGRRSTGFNPRANERYDNNIYRRSWRWRGRGSRAGGEECRCTVYLFRAKYCGHDVIVDFREIAYVAGAARF